MTDERTRMLLGWLGKIVTVRLTAGTPAAPTKLCEGVLSLSTDGKRGELAAYLMECSLMGRTYTGRVVSVLRRYDDGADKLIVAPVGREVYEPWIRAAVAEVEDVQKARFFCLYEKSCGIIPYRVRNGRLEYLALYQAGSGTWSFPKGHVEWGENEIDTARREVLEEIGVEVRISREFRCEISYAVHNRRSKKRVVLYAVPFDGEVTLRVGEIESAKWLPRADIQKLFGHRELRGIFNRLEKLVQGTAIPKK